MDCRQCGRSVEARHRYCPWCGSAQVRKAVALFPPHPEVQASGRGLRVSRYFDPADGPPHTRLSVYDGDGRVTCVVALDDAATSGLAEFLDGIATPPPAPQRGVLARLRDRLTPPAAG